MEINENTDGAAEQANRVNIIAGVLGPAASAVLAAKGEAAAASVILKDLSGKHTNTRMDTMAALAASSQMGQWADSEITVAIGEVKRRHNNPDTIKALDTYLGEVKDAVHPKVRAHVPHFIALCAAAWLADTKDDAPCKEAFKREYHMTVRAFRHLKDGGTFFTTVDDVVDWARANDPTLDIGIVLMRLQ